MKVRLDREHTVECVPEQSPDDPLRHRLPGMEHRILSHVRQVGSHERHAPGSRPPQRIRRQQRLDETQIRIGERPHQDHVAPDRSPHPHQALTVGKAMDGNRHGAPPRRPGKRSSEGSGVGKDMEGRRHRLVVIR